MDYYGIEMIGEFTLEKISLPAWSSNDKGRLIYDIDNDTLVIGGPSNWLSSVNESSFDSHVTDFNNHTSATGNSVHGLGTISTQNNNTVNITGGSITGLTSPLTIGDGTNSNPAFSFSSDINTGTYRIGADNIGISCGGILSLDINSSRIRLYDNQELNFGNGSDFKFYHNGTDNVIGSENGKILIYDLDNTQHMIEAIPGGSTSIYHNGIWKFMSTGDGAEVNGNLLVGDGTVSLTSVGFRNDPNSGLYRIGADNIGISCGGTKSLDITSGRLLLNDSQRMDFGDSSDFRFYHNGTNNIIDTRNGNIDLFNGSSSNYMARFIPNGSSEIYHNGTLKIATQSIGISINGISRSNNGSVSDPAYSFTSDTDTGIYRSNTNQLSITAGGTTITKYDSIGLYVNISGTNSAPAIRINDPNSGMYRIGEDNIGFSTGAVRRMDLNNSGMLLSIGARINEFSTDATLGDNSNTAVPTEQAVKTYIANTVSGAGLPSGTVMLFGQSSAPVGWTKYTSWTNDSMLVVTNGSISGGGSQNPWSYSPVVGVNNHTSHSHTVNAHSHTVNAHSHTIGTHGHTTNSHSLSKTEIPSHKHNYYSNNNYQTSGAGPNWSTANTGANVHETDGGQGLSGSAVGNAHNHGDTGADGSGSTSSNGTNTGSSGTSTGGPTSTISHTVSQSTSFAPKYRKVIAAVKN